MSAITFAGVLFSLIALVVAIALLGFEDRRRRRIIADYRDQNGRILEYNDTLARQLHNNMVGQLRDRVAYLEVYVGSAFLAGDPEDAARRDRQNDKPVDWPTSDKFGDWAGPGPATPAALEHARAHKLPIPDTAADHMPACAHCGKEPAAFCRDCYTLRYERRTPGGTSYGSPKGYSLIATKAVKVRAEGDYPSLPAVVDAYAAEGCDFFVLQSVLEHEGAYSMQIYKAAR